MANNWWDKFLDLFTEEVDEEQATVRDSRQERPAKVEKNQYRRYPGRIEEMHRPVRPRMLNHYPQRNGLRVPVTDDRRGEIRRPPRRRYRKNAEPEKDNRSENGIKSTRRRKENTHSEKAARHHQDEEPPRTHRKHERKSDVEAQHPIREKFAGVDFRASDIPSPVYGFRNRPDLRERLVEEQSETRPPENSVAPRGEQESAAEPEPIEYGPPEQASGTYEKQERYTSPMEDLYFYGHSDHEVDHEDDHEAVLEVEESEGSPDYQEDEEEKEFRDPFPIGVESETEETVIPEEEPVQEKEQVVHQKSQQRETVEKGRTANTNVPYNVMMLKRDQPKEKNRTVSKHGGYRLPEPDLLDGSHVESDEDEEWIAEQRERLSETLRHFNVKAKVVGVTRGPAVTRFEVQPAPGVKVSKIKKLNDDLKLNLAAKDIRIEAPIPGKNTVGIEIPNRTSQPVFLREMIESRAFQNSQSPLTAALGLDISGTPIVTDLRKMPHGLIGGATGSGKSVCINSLLISLLYKVSPDDLKLILIDPKVVELAPFKDIPHLAAPVINDPKQAAQALKWAVEEMERRYEQFAETGARDIARYNQKVQADSRMPYIVIVIDELADLMMASPQDVEESICRIAQKARACGIHLILATQRPSVDVITGLIKANIPTRIAFSVSSQADSRTILDIGGAEKLLGHGDMLFVENGAPQTVRIQGNFVSDDEIDRITEFVKRQGKPDYLFEKEQLKPAAAEDGGEDELFEEACFFVFEQGSASASALQRKFRIGYNRAARLIDMMESRGMISGAMGSKPRDLLISEDEFLEAYVK